MHVIGRNDHPAAGDLRADQFRLELLVAGNGLHLGRNNAGKGLFELGHAIQVYSFGFQYSVFGCQFFKSLFLSHPHYIRIKTLFPGGAWEQVPLKKDGLINPSHLLHRKYCDFTREYAIYCGKWPLISSSARSWAL